MFVNDLKVKEESKQELDITLEMIREFLGAMSFKMGHCAGPRSQLAGAVIATRVQYSSGDGESPSLQVHWETLLSSLLPLWDQWGG